VVAWEGGQAGAAYYGDVDRAWKGGVSSGIGALKGEREGDWALTVEVGGKGEDVDGHGGGFAGKLKNWKERVFAVLSLCDSEMVRRVRARF
jgi:hypothetical protein